MIVAMIKVAALGVAIDLWHLSFLHGIQQGYVE
jgi:hypothetical protein